MIDLKKIQEEQLKWSTRNFGNTPAHRPLLGVIEEFGEFCVAAAAGDDAQVVDAIGDIGIYMLDYCNRRGWDLQALWDNRKESIFDPMNTVRRLAHHQLKGEQNIRGGTAAHDDSLRVVLSEILYGVDFSARKRGTDFLTVLEKVWDKVSKRDWTKNPNDAHEVAGG